MGNEQYICPGITDTKLVGEDGIGHRGGAFSFGGGGAFCDEAPRDDAGPPRADAVTFGDESIIGIQQVEKRNEEQAPTNPNGYEINRRIRGLPQTRIRPRGDIEFRPWRSFGRPKRRRVWCVVRGVIRVVICVLCIVRCV